MWASAYHCGACSRQRRCCSLNPSRYQIHIVDGGSPGPSGCSHASPEASQTVPSGPHTAHGPAGVSLQLELQLSTLGRVMAMVEGGSCGRQFKRQDVVGSGSRSGICVRS